MGFPILAHFVPLVKILMCLLFCRVPTVPVKNLSGSSPVNPALAGKRK